MRGDLLKYFAHDVKKIRRKTNQSLEVRKCAIALDNVIKNCLKLETHSPKAIALQEELKKYLKENFATGGGDRLVISKINANTANDKMKDLINFYKEIKQEEQRQANGISTDANNQNKSNASYASKNQDDFYANNSSSNLEGDFYGGTSRSTYCGRGGGDFYL